MKSNSVQLEALVVGREGVALSPPLDMALNAGDMLAVYGNNGSGKSTLLKTIAGLLPPIDGKITRLAEYTGPESLLYVGHKLGLFSEMSVYDNVALWANLRDSPELIAAALHYFDLTDITSLPVHRLSAGWQQRVALSRLITVPSKLWLLDEPTANLDNDGIVLLRSLIEARLAQSGIVIVATHIPLHAQGIKALHMS